MGSIKKIALFFCCSFYSLGASSQDKKPWTAPPQLLENLSKKQPDFNYFEEKVPSYILPDVLVASNGRKVTTARLWNEVRRPEILELFRENIYGRPPSAPFLQDFKIMNVDKGALNGNATLKQIAISLTAENKSLVINFALFTPNKSSTPAPVFVLINLAKHSYKNDVADLTRQVKSEFWPVEEVIARGYGTAVYNTEEVDPDYHDHFRNGIQSILDKGKRDAGSWGSIAAWAWGASRCMDYLVTDKDVNPEKVAVVGHSAGGKTALWAGAEDVRFALVISNQSGCGGAALSRRRYGETIARINRVFPHWFCTNHLKYSDNEDALPVDKHMLIALIAPRAVYVSSADEDLWADPRGEYLSLYHATPVYQLFMKKTDFPVTMPPLNTQFVSGEMAYHIVEGPHNMTLKDWNHYMDFANMVFK